MIPCYTLISDAVPGIAVKDYESILTDDPGTTHIHHGSLMMYPLFQSPPVDFVKMTLQSLTFVRESSVRDEPQNGVILSVDASKWRLLENPGVSLLDPGGRNGFILVHAMPGCTVLHSRHSTKALWIDDDGKPEVCGISRGNAMFDALRKASAEAPAPAVPSFSKARKAGKARKVSLRPGILPPP